MSVEVVRRAIEPGYSERRSAGIKAARRLRSDDPRTGKIEHFPYMSPAAKREAERQLAELPPDTRGLTAKICGDPMPGRSALDRKAGR